MSTSRRYVTALASIEAMKRRADRLPAICAEYRKCVPSGRNEGHLRPSSDRALSASRNTDGSPPAAWTRMMRPLALNRITPFAFHVPPLPLATLQMVFTGPPSAAMTFNCPSAKNPMERLSGDQNCHDPPSVPSSNFDSRLSRRRSQSLRSPTRFPRLTPNTIIRPSGEMTGGASAADDEASRPSDDCETVNRIGAGGACSDGRRTIKKLTDTSETANKAATAHGSHGPGCRAAFRLTRLDDARRA